MSTRAPGRFSRPRPAWQAWTGLWTAAVAVAARAVIGVGQPAVVPFPLLFPAILAATLIAGTPAGLICLCVGGPAAALLFEPRNGGSLAAIGVASPLGLALSVLSALAIIALAERHRRALTSIASLRRASDEDRAALEESEARLRLATEAAGVGIWEWRPPTGEIIYSAEARAICGLPPDSPLTYDGVAALTHPDDVARAQAQTERAFDPAIRDDAPYEYRIRRPDGKERCVTAYGRPVFETGPEGSTVTRYIGTLVDVTERKRAEQAARSSERRLALALEGARMAIWQTDPEGRLSSSPSMNVLIGLPADARPTLEDIAGNFLPGHLERFAEASARAIDRGEEHYEVDYGYRTPSGEIRWFNSRARLMHGDDGEPRGAIGVAVDITERRLAEERVLLLNREIDHRANNLMSVIQSTVMLSRADSVEAFRETVLGRLHALALAHQLLSDTRWLGADLRRLVEEELAPFSLGESARVRIEGPAVALRPGAAQSVAMAVHELATNAAKHGALSEPAGTVEVGWSMTEGRLGLSWRESGGPPVAPPARRGFGTTLLSRALAGVGAARLDWRSEGLICELDVDVRPAA